MLSGNGAPATRCHFPGSFEGGSRSGNGHAASGSPESNSSSRRPETQVSKCSVTLRVPTSQTTFMPFHRSPGFPSGLACEIWRRRYGEYGSAENDSRENSLAANKQRFTASPLSVWGLIRGDKIVSRRYRAFVGVGTGIDLCVVSGYASPRGCCFERLFSSATLRSPSH